MESFCTVGGKIQLIVSTTAFGLGVDCPDISKIIHWGSPTIMEECIQESGCGGRNGEHAVATFYNSKPGTHVTDLMKEYLANDTSCWCRFLFQNFLMYSESNMKHGYQCCDVCKKSCICSQCVLLES